MREPGQAAVDKLIREGGLDRAFGLEPGTLFDGGMAVKDKYSKGDWWFLTLIKVSEVDNPR